MPQRTLRRKDQIILHSLRPLRHLRVLCVKLFDPDLSSSGIESDTHVQRAKLWVRSARSASASRPPHAKRLSKAARSASFSSSMAFDRASIVIAPEVLVATSRALATSAALKAVPVVPEASRFVRACR